MSGSMTQEVAVHAARLVVEDGLEFGPAKRRAVRDLGLDSRRIELPSNELLEDEVRQYLQLFRADTQPAELRVLRELALQWMDRLAEFRPHVSGAVWRGTATRLSGVWIGLFCDDSKAAEIALLNQRVHFDVGTTSGLQGQPVDVLSIAQRVAGWPEPAWVHLVVHDLDDLRGALRPDRRGLTERGEAAALRRLMTKEDSK